MEFSAPFLATYWPYIVSILAGIFIAQLIRRIFQSQTPSYTVDVDPLEDTDVAAIPSPDPLGFRTSGEGEAVHIPYPWFDDRLTEEEMKKKSAEFYEKMNKRRTVRKISDEDIPLEVVENIIRTAGKHGISISQPRRHLYVITHASLQKKNVFLPLLFLHPHEIQGVSLQEASAELSKFKHCGAMCSMINHFPGGTSGVLALARGVGTSQGCSGSQWNLLRYILAY